MNDEKKKQPQETPEGDGPEESAKSDSPAEKKEAEETAEASGKKKQSEARKSESKEETEAKGDSSESASGDRKSQDESKPEKEKPAAKSDAKQPAAKEAAGDKPAAKAPAKKPVKRRPVRSRGPSYEDLEEDDLLDALKERFGESAVAGQQFLDQPIYTVDFEALYDVMIYLRDDPDRQFDYLVDLTALDHLGEEKRFTLVYHLYSHPHNVLIRVKSKLEEGVFAPSVTSIWTTADWLEREAFDMFGIEFSGHPDLRRILLPDDWHGYPLRKDYDIKLQDQSWIRKHLRIRKVPT